ncbi:MAG: hypothetical protein HUU06_07425, partial [Planctomycetaceae bacterium]|nr:hypothetical protein [Planctomycetaceae bacterium]
EAPPAPEAILGISRGRSPGEAAVVRAGGRVDFVALADGGVAATIETGAVAWATRYPHAGEMPPAYEFRHEESTVMAGLPAASVDGRTVAVAGSELLEWSGAAGPRSLLRDPVLLGARLAAHRGPGTPILLALKDHRVARIDPAGRMTLSRALPPLTCLVSTEDGAVAGGEGDSWHLLRGERLDRILRVRLEGWTPPVTALAVSEAGDHVAVSHGLCLPDNAVFRLRRLWKPSLARVFHAKGPGAVSVAFDPGQGTLYLGKACGGVGYCGDFGYHGFPLGGNPHHAIALLDGGRVLLRGWDDGTLYAERVPEEEGLWGDYPVKRRGD